MLTTMTTKFYLFLLRTRKNARIRIGVLDALTFYSLLLAEGQIERNVQHHHPGEIFGEGQLLVGRQFR